MATLEDRKGKVQNQKTVHLLPHGPAEASRGFELRNRIANTDAVPKDCGTQTFPR